MSEFDEVREFSRLTDAKEIEELSHHCLEHDTQETWKDIEKEKMKPWEEQRPLEEVIDKNCHARQLGCKNDNDFKEVVKETVENGTLFTRREEGNNANLYYWPESGVVVIQNLDMPEKSTCFPIDVAKYPNELARRKKIKRMGYNEC